MVNSLLLFYKITLVRQFILKHLISKILYFRPFNKLCMTLFSILDLLQKLLVYLSFVLIEWQQLCSIQFLHMEMQIFWSRQEYGIFCFNFWIGSFLLYDPPPLDDTLYEPFVFKMKHQRYSSNCVVCKGSGSFNCKMPLNMSKVFLTCSDYKNRKIQNQAENILRFIALSLSMYE